MPPAVVNTVKPPGIAGQHRLHQPTGRRLLDLQQEMKMIRHEDIGIERKGGTLSGGLEGSKKGVIISRHQIDSLSIIAAGHEVIEHPWGVDAWVTSHEQRVSYYAN